MIISKHKGACIASLEWEIKSLLECELLETEHILTPPEEVMIITSLTNWCVNAIAKYVRGSKEHGGSLLIGRDLPKEIYQEDLDRFWYASAEQYKKENKT